jgi:hypothetical protein
MTNITKWFVAIPFAACVSLVIPALVAGNPLWFLDHWTDTLYVSLSAGMWLIATAFVDVKRPRGSPDLANLLIPLGLILSVPLSVWDRVFWIASTGSLSLLEEAESYRLAVERDQCGAIPYRWSGSGRRQLRGHSSAAGRYLESSLP